MAEAYFVSDIHLTGADDPKFARFLRFLQFCLCQPPRHLFLVGDIFDLWIADRPYFVRRYQPVIDILSQLVRAGVNIHYFEGNHDLDLRAYWEKIVGVEVHERAAYFDLGAQPIRVRVEHGDEMDPGDRGYLFLRWLLRTPVLRVLGRHLPHRLVAAIGERASHASRGYTTSVKTVSPESALAKMRLHGERVRAEAPFEVLVCGHTHRRADLDLGHGARLFNLGTWLEEALVLALGRDGTWRFTDVSNLTQR